MRKCVAKELVDKVSNIHYLTFTTHHPLIHLQNSIFGSKNAYR